MRPRLNLIIVLTLLAIISIALSGCEEHITPAEFVAQRQHCIDAGLTYTEQYSIWDGRLLRIHCTESIK